jgi:hypothetical protein
MVRKPPIENENHFLKGRFEQLVKNFNKCVPFFPLRIHNEHAVIILDQKTNKVKIRPIEKDCRLIHNGTSVTGETTLVICFAVLQ